MELNSVDHQQIKGHSTFSLGKRSFQSLETMDSINDNPSVAEKIQSKHLQNKLLEAEKQANANYSINEKSILAPTMKPKSRRTKAVSPTPLKKNGISDLKRKIDMISNNPKDHNGTEKLFNVNSEMNVRLSNALFEFEHSLEKLKVAAGNYLEDECSDSCLNESKHSRKSNKAYQKFSEQFDSEYNLANLMFGPSSHFNYTKIEEPLFETPRSSKFDKKKFSRRSTIAEPLRNKVHQDEGPQDIRNYGVSKKLKSDFSYMINQNECIKQKTEQLLDNAEDFENKPQSPNKNMMYNFLENDPRHSVVSSCDDSSRSDMNYALGGTPNLTSNYGEVLKKILTEEEQDLWNDGNWLSKADNYGSFNGLEPQMGVDFNQPFSCFNMNIGCDFKNGHNKR